MSGFLAILKRDLRLAVRIGGGAGLGVAFFLVVTTLIPLGVGPAPEILARIAPGMLWVAALLSCLLTLDRMFQADQEDGALDLLALGPVPLELVVLAKVLAHWLTTGAPLVLAAPVLAITLRLPEGAYLPLVLSMLIGTPALSLIGAIGAALTAGLRRGGLLTTILVLPLYTPSLIFGALAVQAGALGFEAGPHLLFSGAITLGCCVLCPIAAAAALRLALD